MGVAPKDGAQIVSLTEMGSDSFDAQHGLAIHVRQNCGGTHGEFAETDMRSG
ncbi:hypothetical protein JCM19992_17790 [Thermostilla marina]